MKWYILGALGLYVLIGSFLALILAWASGERLTISWATCKYVLLWPRLLSIFRG